MPRRIASSCAKARARGVEPATAAPALSASGTHSSTAPAPSGAIPRASGPSISRPEARRAVASAVPRRPAPTIAQRVGVGVRSSSRMGDTGWSGCSVDPANSGVADRSRRGRGYGGRVPSAEARREALKAVWQQAQTCTKCPQLAATRTKVVFGAGNADADLMFVGEAPGANEDRLGLPFVGQAGKLLDTLLGEIGLTRDEVFIANVLKCRPPGNRDPLPQEIDNCQDYLFRQLELIEPRVVCTLGNFATKLLRADPGTGITKLHGREEERVIGPRAVRLYPIYHPAAALYTRSLLDTLRADFARLPDLLALDPPAQPEPAAEPEPEPEPAEAIVPEPEIVEEIEAARVMEHEASETQLGLF